QHVVEEAHGDARLIELEVGQQPGDVERVDHERLAGAARLILVHLGGEVVDGAQEDGIESPPVLGKAREHLLEAHHSRRSHGRLQAFGERHGRLPATRAPVEEVFRGPRYGGPTLYPPLITPALFSPPAPLPPVRVTAIPGTPHPCYRQAGPRENTTNEVRMPRVTGVTRCCTKAGNATMAPRCLSKAVGSPVKTCRSPPS